MTSTDTFTQVGAFQIIDDHNAIWHGPRSCDDAVIRRFCEIAERDGLLINCPGECDHTMILDLYVEDGIADNRCVVDEKAWAAVNSELALAPQPREVRDGIYDDI